MKDHNVPLALHLSSEFKISDHNKLLNQQWVSESTKVTGLNGIPFNLRREPKTPLKVSQCDTLLLSDIVQQVH